MLDAKELQARLIHSGLCPASQLIGCTARDFHIMESHIGDSLPDSYKQVMSVIGKGAGKFISDLEMYYPKVTTLTERIRNLVSSNVTLPKDAFVFANRFGEQFLFFRLAEARDGHEPVVYRWHDEDPKRFSRVFGSIWEFIEEELVSHEEVLDDGPEDPDE